MPSWIGLPIVTIPLKKAYDLFESGLLNTLELLQSALTNKINDRETFMKGIDYSYYYEEEA